MMAVVDLDLVRSLYKTPGAAQLKLDVAPRFKLGDVVVALNINPSGHTRLPRYIRGKKGVVERDHGVDGRGVGGVGDNGDDATARGVRQLRRCRLQRFPGPGADGDIDTLEGQLLGNQPSDPLAAARHKGDFVLQLQVHGCPRSCENPAGGVKGIQSCGGGQGKGSLAQSRRGSMLQFDGTPAGVTQR